MLPCAPTVCKFEQHAFQHDLDLPDGDGADEGVHAQQRLGEAVDDRHTREVHLLDTQIELST